MADTFGRKRLFITGVIGFAVAPAVGGAAVSFPMLVAARAVQGAFGAMLAPAALSLLTTTFTHPDEWGKAFGIYGGIAAEAGVNVATAYRHFANKHELADAFLQQKIEQALTITEEVAAAEDPWQGLTDFPARMLDLLVANRGLHDIFSPGIADERLERLDKQVEPILRDLIERAQRAGTVRDGIEPGDLAVALQMLATVTDIPTDDRPTLLKRYLELILAGLRPSKTPCREPHRRPHRPDSQSRHPGAGPSRRGYSPVGYPLRSTRPGSAAVRRLPRSRGLHGPAQRVTQPRTRRA